MYRTRLSCRSATGDNRGGTCRSEAPRTFCSAQLKGIRFRIPLSGPPGPQRDGELRVVFGKQLRVPALGENSPSDQGRRACSMSKVRTEISTPCSFSNCFHQIPNPTSHLSQGSLGLSPLRIRIGSDCRGRHGLFLTMRHAGWISSTVVTLAAPRELL